MYIQSAICSVYISMIGASTVFRHILCFWRLSLFYCLSLHAYFSLYPFSWKRKIFLNKMKLSFNSLTNCTCFVCVPKCTWNNKKELRRYVWVFLPIGRLKNWSKKGTKTNTKSFRKLTIWWFMMRTNDSIENLFTTHHVFNSRWLMPLTLLLYSQNGLNLKKKERNCMCVCICVPVCLKIDMR